MSSFTGALILTDNEDGETFTVFERFRYYVGIEGSNVYRDVHRGFITNLASKPFFMRRTGRYNRAAVLHDALYASPYVIVRKGDAGIMTPITRQECDKIFLEAMLITMPVLGESFLTKLCNSKERARAYSYYAAVRAFGWTHWKHDRPR